MKTKHHIRRTACATVLALSMGAITAPVGASGVPSVDAVHIATNQINSIMKYISDYSAWYSDSMRWVGQMKSMMQDPMGVVKDQFAAMGLQSTEEDINKALETFKTANACGRVKEDKAKELCQLEHKLRYEKAEGQIAAAKEIELTAEAVQQAKQEYDDEAKRSQNMNVSADGGENNSGQLQSKANQLATQMQNHTIAIQLADRKAKNADIRIEAVHMARVSHNQDLIEGKGPGDFGELITVTATVGVLKAEEDYYKRRINEKKSATSRY